MEPTAKSVSIYQTEKGDQPYAKWESSLDKGIRARVLTRIDRVKQGNFGDCKSLGDGVRELRMTFGSGYRVYYGLDGDTVVILLCGGDKSTQSADIETAKAYWADYERRKNG